MFQKNLIYALTNEIDQLMIRSTKNNYSYNFQIPEYFNHRTYFVRE
jgi:hypothetical protein